MNLPNYFDRVVVISLKRRAHRLEAFKAALKSSGWPFMQPTVFEAVDGDLIPPPEGWQSGNGAWGCMRSHQRVFEDAMRDGIERLFVLEDDACFAPDFSERVREFCRQVPPNWDQLMLGGEHINKNGIPVLVKPGVYRCTDCERTHGYAIRSAFLRKLYRRWMSGGQFNGEVHCDWIMGRDPDMQYKHRCYAPERFLIGQEHGRSDINGRIQTRNFWNPPDPHLPVILLKASASVAAVLRHYGFYTGDNGDPLTEMDRPLTEVFAETKSRSDARIEQLGNWIMARQWQVASDSFLICTVWHPEATFELVSMACSGTVHEVSGTDAAEILGQLPPQLRRPFRPSLARSCIVYLKAPRRVMEELRTQGWHDGNGPKGVTGADDQFVRLCQEFPERSKRVAALRPIVRNLQLEAEAIHEGVPVVWHSEIDATTMRGTNTNVVTIRAETLRDALEQWQSAKSMLLNALALKNKALLDKNA